MKFHRLLATAFSGTAFLLISDSAQSALVVYEGFDYTVGSDIQGQGSGLGWTAGGTGNWASSGGTNLPDVVAGETFPSLEVSGGAIQRPTRDGNSAISRLISTTSQTGLTADSSTIWFSVLMNPTEVVPGNNGFALNSYGTIVFGDTALTGGSGNQAAPIGVGGNAFGVGFAGTPAGPGQDDFANMRVQGVSYDNGTLIQAGQTTVGAGATLIVGKIDWAVDGTNDTLNLFIVSDPTAALPAAFVTMTADFDQSTFNVVSIGDAQTSTFDEIRFGTEVGDVMPIPEPSTLALVGLSALALMRRRRA